MKKQTLNFQIVNFLKMPLFGEERDGVWGGERRCLGWRETVLGCAPVGHEIRPLCHPKNKGLLQNLKKGEQQPFSIV